MKQRGFFTIPSLTQAVIVLGVVAAAASAIWGAVAWHANTHYQRGRDAERADQYKKKEEEAAADWARHDRIAAALLLEEQRRMDAEIRADQAERQWKEVRRENRNKSLAACPVAGGASANEPVRDAGGSAAALAPEPAPVGGLVPRARDAAGPVYLTWRFVGLHDGAFIAPFGDEPVYGSAARFALEPSRVDTASPYSLDDLVDVVGENARALSECLRAYGQAMSAIDRAAAAWDKRP